MLWTSEQVNMYEKYLECVDEEKDIFIAKDAKNIPSEDRDILLDDDEWFFISKGYHMIQNVEELK